MKDNVQINYASIRFSAFGMNIADFEKLEETEIKDSDLLRQAVTDFEGVKFTNFDNLPEFWSSLQNEGTQNYLLGENNIEVECDY